MKKGDNIIWDTGFGYEVGTYIKDTHEQMYNSVKVDIHTGIVTGEMMITKLEIEKRTDALEKQLENKYGYRFENRTKIYKQISH